MPLLTTRDKSLRSSTPPIDFCSAGTCYFLTKMLKCQIRFESKTMIEKVRSNSGREFNITRRTFTLKTAKIAALMVGLVRGEIFNMTLPEPKKIPEDEKIPYINPDVLMSNPGDYTKLKALQTKGFPEVTNTEVKSLTGESIPLWGQRRQLYPIVQEIQTFDIHLIPHTDSKSIKGIRSRIIIFGEVSPTEPDLSFNKRLVFTGNIVELPGKNGTEYIFHTKSIKPPTLIT